MRLAVVNLTGGGFSGGYRKYLKNILPRFAAHRDVQALLCISPEGNDIPTWFEKPPVAEYCSCSRLTLRHLAHFPDKKMAQCLASFSPDIIFLPVDRYVRFKDVPVVNMVRNMEPFIPNMPGDSAREILKKYIQRKLTSSSVRRADHTVAVSDFVQNYLTSQLNIPEHKVSRIYHGLMPPIKESCARPVTVPAGWNNNFLFTCGSIRPARGLEDILEALAELKIRNKAVRLVIAGETVPGMRNYRSKLERFLALKGLSASVCWAGNLSDDEMCWCYSNCGVFVMTSRIEACPNIAMEAMSYGAISIAAQNPPLPEFFSECAAYYAAGNPQVLADAVLDRLALSSAQRSTIAEQARKRSLMFSWDQTTERTLSVLKRVANSS